MSQQVRSASPMVISRAYAEVVAVQAEMSAMTRLIDEVPSIYNVATLGSRIGDLSIRLFEATRSFAKEMERLDKQEQG